MSLNPFSRSSAFNGKHALRVNTIVVWLVATFLLLIVIGTGLLMLPAMSTLPSGLSFLDALFMATSASCVTGLSVIDTATDLTTQGQLVILGLFQIGGLSILVFAAFFTFLLNSKLRIHHAKILPDYLDGETLGSARALLKRIVLFTVLIETGTFVALLYTWGSYPFSSWSERIFFSLFHAASAFCNAGFSLFSQGFYEPVIRDMYVLHAVVSVTIVLGSLGFATLNNIFSPQQLRQRLEKPWIDWHLSTKVAVNTTLLLLVVGTISFYWLEKSNTLSGMNLTESLIGSFFQSATARTAGFNTVDISQITIPTTVLLMFLMFIGGSSGSTAGGIKTSTFFLLIASVISTSRGSSQITIGNRHISNGVVFKALSIFFYGIVINLIGVFILSISEPQLPLIDITFEQVSAFGTVGLSRGITASLSEVGKAVIIATMFLGRVGTLTFAIALSARAIPQNYKLPEEELMVG
ncbi:TrkH family potassium uptake protein [Tunicatimonas pelagia]|uniref:TrkH family potassium uptake protein n=1 Tax=Tunicatimonas pelagia TaxID=931531 RepID=UPI002666CD09|nr:potassium transporter TrkG [Tunicatimonas pelagia]WKN45284.1 potassium transporter TrkG [Tunicatimonas pelagia]